MKYVLEFVKIPLLKKSEYKSLLSACGGFCFGHKLHKFSQIGVLTY
jgi:hypothetical protein